MQKIKIEKMLFMDLPQIMRLEKETGLERWSEKNYEESLKNPNYNMLVAKAENRILGFVTTYHASNEGYICNIAVDKIARNNGIGTDLINKIIELSKIQNVKSLSLEVRESNATAIKFYEKLGFTKIGVRKNFYFSPTEHALIMTKYF